MAIAHRLLAALLLVAGFVGGCAVRTEPPSAAAATPALRTTDPPMPPGPWTLVYRDSEDIAYGVSERAIWVSTVGTVVDRAVLVYEVDLGRRYRLLPRESCASPEYFSQVVDEIDPDRGRCRHVRAVNLGLAGDPHRINVLLAEYAAANGLFLPATMIGVRFIDYRGGDMLQVDYLWTPDLLLPPPPGRVWTPDDWTNAAVDADPRRRVIMRSLDRWGEDWQSRMPAADARPAAGASSTWPMVTSR